MSYILGYPMIRGNSQEIVVYELGCVEKTDLIGTVVSKDKDGKVVPYAEGTPILGVAGIETSGSIDVTREGLEVVVLLEEDCMPNGSTAFLGKNGTVTTTGTLAIGRFCTNHFVKAYNPNLEINKKAALVDLQISFIEGTPKDPASKEGLGFKTQKNSQKIKEQ